MFTTYNEISDYSVTTFSFGGIRQSLFRLLGTGQFKVSAKDTDGQLNVTLTYKNKYIKSGSESYVYRYQVEELGKVNDSTFSTWYLNFVRKNINEIKKEIKKVEKELKRQERIENKYKKLEEKYNELVETEKWYYAPDFSFDINEEDALTNSMVWAFKKNSETGWGYNIPRASFILEVHGAEVIRYCHVENCYFSIVNYGLTEKVEAINWYAQGFRHGYDCGYSGNLDPEYEEPPIPEFPNSVAKEIFMMGLSHGGRQGYMDT